VNILRLGVGISGSRAELGTFEIAEPELSTKATGTEVMIEGIDKNFPSLEGDTAVQEITQHLLSTLGNIQTL
jgi:hypothetical protein